MSNFAQTAAEKVLLTQWVDDNGEDGQIPFTFNMGSGISVDLSLCIFCVYRINVMCQLNFIQSNCSTAPTNPLANELIITSKMVKM